MKEFATIQDMSLMPFWERMSHAMVITILGMGITFILLIALLYITRAMSVILNPKGQDSEAQIVLEEAPIVKEDEEDEEELVAVLMAAIAASTGQAYETIKIRSFRELGTSLPLWSQAGVDETMNREI